jgi:hypothetical protein
LSGVGSRFALSSTVFYAFRDIGVLVLNPM